MREIPHATARGPEKNRQGKTRGRRCHPPQQCRPRCRSSPLDIPELNKQDQLRIMSALQALRYYNPQLPRNQQGTTTRRQLACLLGADTQTLIATYRSETKQKEVRLTYLSRGNGKGETVPQVSESPHFQIRAAGQAPFQK